VLTWERAHRTDRRRRSRKAWQLSIDLLTFVVTAVVALAITARLSQPTPLMQAVVSAELAASVLLAYQIVAHAVRP
jgi:uncharacterized membrane protein YoaK (UPF0700 family)